MDEGIKEPVSRSEEDFLLVRAFQGGDRGAFDRLVLKHKDRLFNLCYRYLSDYEEANDSAQDTFIKAYAGLKGFRFESAFSTWLYRIAVNTCKNKIQSSEYRHRHETVSLEQTGNPDHGRPGTDIQNGSPSPALHLEEKERKTIIMGAVDALPPEHREMITLRDIEGLSYEEIVEVTGLNPGTVKSRLSRARLDLASKLRGMV
jgi:RNA polymerase sigma-70 factor (ECF subfamily)